VVSSDENGNFQSYFFADFGTTTAPAVGFSVPVDATNTYVDFRMGIKYM
jgi:hypothetical protein